MTPDLQPLLQSAERHPYWELSVSRFLGLTNHRPDDHWNVSIRTWAWTTRPPLSFPAWYLNSACSAGGPDAEAVVQQVIVQLDRL